MSRQSSRGSSGSRGATLTRTSAQSAWLGRGASTGARRLRAFAFALLVLAGALALAQPAFAEGMPAWELFVLHGPTNIPSHQPVPNRWTIRISGAEGAPNLGRFEIELERRNKTAVTKSIAFDASPALVAEEIEAARVLNENEKRTKETLGLEGSIHVTGGPQGKGESEWQYVVEEAGPLIGHNLEAVEVEEEKPTTKEKANVRKHKEEEDEAEYESALLERGRVNEVVYMITPINKGGAPTKGTITVTDTLPKGVTAVSVRGKNAEDIPQEAWDCNPPESEEVEPVTTVECKTEQVINPYSPATGSKEINSIEIVGAVEPKQAEADEKSGMPLANVTTVEGGGVPEAEKAIKDATVSDTPATFGITDFTAGPSGVDGEVATVAGGHPYAATTSFALNTRSVYNPGTEETEIFTNDNLKDANVQLTEGLVGNPTALRNGKGEVARCQQAEFVEGLNEGPHPDRPQGGCPPDTQVGVAALYIARLAGHGGERQPVYDLVPPPGVPAEFGVYAGTNKVPIRLDAHVVRVHGTYQIVVASVDVNQALNINAVWLTLWGVPGDASHNPERTRSDHEERGQEYLSNEVLPFLTDPTDCVAQAEAPPMTMVHYDSWSNPAPESGEASLFSAPQWLETSATSKAVTGCQKLEFNPTIAYAPRHGEGDEGSYEASASSGYEFVLEIPQSESTSTLGTPQLKDTTVTLPAGLVVNPSAANGLQGCELSQLDVESTARGGCPEASQIGEVKIRTPLLLEELSGRVYIATPECEPCNAADAEDGKLLKLFIEAEGNGVRVKLPGFATVNTETGQLKTTFENDPQTPFNRLILKIKGGPNASLANPQLCGSYPTLAELTPWSIAGKLGETTIEGDTTVALESNPFVVSWNGEGESCPSTPPFSPTFSTGTENSKAGAYSSFDTVFKRGDDREQYFKGITVNLPLGLVGKVAGIARCDEAQAVEGTCPESSLIGSASAVVGSGEEGFAVGGGKVYLTNELTGKFKGDPFGLSISIPAKAGPFNLGTEVVTAGIHVNPETAAISIDSEPLKQMRDGVPFRIKEVDVYVNRPEFTINATNCEEKKVQATISGAPAAAGEAEQSVTREAPYTASDCAGLKFDPQVNASTDGQTSKKLGASLIVKVSQRSGEANIHRVEVQLPEALPSKLETLQKACIDTQFASNPAGCPEGSIVGYATAKTPILSSPLTGPAYLVSHGNAAFPGLEFVLQGEGVKVVLDGKTRVKDGITEAKFETVPDAPVSSFEAVFPEKEHSILAAYGVLCEKELIAPTVIIAQNNMEIHQQTKIAVTNCPPSVQITGTRASGNSLVVTLKVSQAGTVTVSGSAVKATRAHLSAGTHTLQVALSKAGLKARGKHKRIKLTATIAVDGHTAASRTVDVKA